MAVEAARDESVATYAEEASVQREAPARKPRRSLTLQLLGLVFFLVYGVFRLPGLIVLALRSNTLSLQVSTAANRVASHVVVVTLGLLAFWAAPIVSEQLSGRALEPEHEYYGTVLTLRVSASETLFPGVIERPTLLQTTVILRPRDEILDYEIRGNDTLVDIAARNRISLETLLWANDIAPDHLLLLGKTLRIPPVDGVIYRVVDGDVLHKIAEEYESNPVAIAEFNRIGLSTTLVPGMELIIPDGILPEALRKSSSSEQLSAREQPVAAFGEFRWPTHGAITQYFHAYHPGLDIGNRTGTPIVAADAGQVVVAGWSAIGYGNRIVINHGNGWVTTYNHLSTFAVTVGDFVKAGEIIGGMGNTGYSTGPHLHFEALYHNRYRDPLALLN